LLAGHQVGTDELLRVSDGIASILPKPPPPALEIRFADGDPATGGRNEEMRLQDEIKELQRKLREALQKVPKPTEMYPGPSQSHGGASGMGNVVPFNAGGSDWSALAMANSPRGPYLPPDKFDEHGRRVDAAGLPASRRIDRDGAA
jgi:hypothetical protein